MQAILAIAGEQKTRTRSANVSYWGNLCIVTPLG
jgi:hypothetical protein